MSDDDPDVVQPLWNEASIPPAERAGRPEAVPQQGVIWITLGEIEITGRQPIRAKKGDVVGYCDDGSLRWTTAGARVRWSAREVDVRPGEARPWTTALSRDLPTGPPRPQPVNPRRRALVATAAWILSAWAIAMLVGCGASQGESAGSTAGSIAPSKDGTFSEQQMDNLDRLMRAVEQRRSSKSASGAPSIDGEFTPAQVESLDRLMRAVEQSRQAKADRERLHDVLARAELTLSSEQERRVLDAQRDYLEKRKDLFGSYRRSGGGAVTDVRSTKMDELQKEHESALRAALVGMSTESIDKVVTALKHSYPGFFPRERPASPAMGGNEAPAPMDGEPAPKEPGK